MPKWGWWMLLAVCFVGCGDDDGATDAAMDASGCETDEACDDGTYCNGAERCAPDDPESDGRGCLAGLPPCPDDMGCSEEEARCVTLDCTDPDRDGDGADSVDCGGSDCDDMDPGRYPGNLEICDPENVDEDCDERTFGVRDLDMDDEPDASCCNGEVCGTDCDDTRAGVNPTATEACNDRDDDCDGAVDEGALAVFTEDADGDGHGSAAEGATTMMACPGAAIEGFAEGLADDCDDDANDVHPGLGESCDDTGRDEDCDGTIDEMCDCTFPSDRPCTMPGVCAMGTEACDSETGRFGMCSIEPERSESRCDGFDEDCDGTTDEGVTIDCYLDEDEDGYPADGATRLASCADPARPFVGGCPSNTTNREPADGADCNDDDPDVHPNAIELCDLSVDHDCDGTVDEGVTVACHLDDDNDTYSPMGSPELDRCPQDGRGSVGGCPTGFTNRAPAAGASDCDDDDTNIRPGVAEQCDGARVDENCNGMQNEGCECDAGDPDIMCDEPGRCAAGTRSCTGGAYGMCSISPVTELCNGEDDDCNGLPDDTFECVQGSDPVACTTSCMTPGTRPCSGSCSLGECTGAEGCNGCDDDGDGDVDEAFTCEQNAPDTACTTACGTAGSGTCNASCTGVPSCFASSETCNYCDDDGDPGTTDEPLASGDATSLARCSSSSLYSGAGCLSGMPDRFTLIQGSTGSDRGAAYYTPASGLYLGWGPLEQHIQIRASKGTTTYPADGWALVLADGGSGFVGGVGGSLAIPENRTGLVVEWHFFTGFAIENETDCVRVARLDGDGNRNFLHGGSCAAIPPTAMHLDRADSGAVTQHLFVRYTPNDGGTLGNEEERIDIWFNDDGSGPPAYSVTGLPFPPPACDPGPCYNIANALTPGGELLLGVTAASGGARSTVEWISGVGAGASQVSQLRRENVCF